MHELVVQELARLRELYLQKLPQSLEHLQQLMHDWLVHQQLQQQEPLRHALHALAGGGGTYGLHQLSQHARELEIYINNWKKMGGGELSEEEYTWCLKMLDRLVAASFHVETVAAPVDTTGGDEAQSSGRVWLIIQDPQLGVELMQQLALFNFSLDLFDSLAAAEQAAQQLQPDVLVVDAQLPTLNQQNLAEALQQSAALSQLKLPVIMVSHEGDFCTRMLASRMNAVGFYLHPVDVSGMAGSILQQLQRDQVVPPRVLIVEDDTHLAEHYRLVLQSQGMQVTILQSPTALMEALEAQRPELILMDLHMPEYSGPELAGVIRQHAQWASVPIVYLSAETDFEQRVSALGRGADDFLMKPISDRELIAAVRVRIERSRLITSLIARDSLTGLLKHASIKDAVEHEVLRSRRSGEPLAVAMLDIDHFKRVNDTYGHAQGDTVIASVATFLRQRLRQTDILGRYGGEEFVALLPGCTLRQAQSLLDEMRERFAQIPFSHDLGDFSCTVSIGVTSTEGQHDLSGEALLQLADAALYQAKRGGRNQVRITE